MDANPADFLNQRYFVVFSARDDMNYLIPKLDEYVRNPPRINLHLLCQVSEYGSSGSHYHMNYVIRCDSRKDSVRRSMYRFLGLNPSEYPRLISVSDIPDMTGLVGYLTKETASELLFCSPELDWDALLEEHKKRQESVKSGGKKGKFQKRAPKLTHIRPISEVQVLDRLVDYFDGFEEGEGIVTRGRFQHFQQCFARDGLYCSRISWDKLYNWLLLRYTDTFTEDEFIPTKI